MRNTAAPLARGHNAPLSEDPAPTALSGAVTSTAAFRIHPLGGEGAIPPDRVGEVGERLEARRGRIRDFLRLAGAVEAEPPADVYLYPTVEAKALATGDMSVGHALPGAGEVHLSVQKGLEGDGVAVEALLSVWRQLGPPAARALDAGLVVHFSDDWLGAPPAFWVNRLHRAGLVPPLSELLDDEAFTAASRLALPPIAAILIEWLLAERGAAGFRDFYQSGALDPDLVRSLEPGWQTHLRRMAATPHGVDGRADTPPPPLDFLRGFNFAHEGYQIHNGFGSRQASLALERLAEIGTNAVAIIPYTSRSDPSASGPFRISNRAGSENDEAVLHSALAARDLGMSVLLKPQIWLRGSWPGEIRMTSQEEWDRFFREYTRWIGHYALMAEAFGLESLCLGVEMSAAALEQPEQWREMARRIRHVYTGELGYCANWGEEVENLEFWDVVDFIGVSSYNPLSARLEPSDAELRREVRRVLDRLESLGRHHRRPVILVEAGFASGPAPWRRPWVDERGPGAEVDLEAQARSYRMLIEGLEGRDGIRGIYWWKWPSTGPRNPLRDPGFTPAGKPAERLVAEWFGRF